MRDENQRLGVGAPPRDGPSLSEAEAAARAEAKLQAALALRDTLLRGGVDAER